MGNQSTAPACPYQFYSTVGKIPICYTPYQHPGTLLLPPKELLKYDSVPQSIVDQISADGEFYDLYGKFGTAFEDSLIDAPTGKAADDYKEWLRYNHDIAEEIHETILANGRALNPDFDYTDDTIDMNKPEAPVQPSKPNNPVSPPQEKIDMTPIPIGFEWLRFDTKDWQPDEFPQKDEEKALN